MSIAKVAFVSSMLLALVSCGGSSNNKSAPQAQEAITEAADYKILFPSQDFPSKGKAMVMVDGEEVLNECQDKQQYSIVRDSEMNSLTMMNRVRPSALTVDVSVSNCVTNDAFMAVEDAAYEMEKIEGHEYLVIDLTKTL